MRFRGWAVGFTLLVLFAVVGVGCAPNVPPAPESDSPQSYEYGARVPVDDNVYSVHGVVVADVSSLTRQTARAQGYYYGYGGGWGGGSYFGPEFEGKGFVRLRVLESDTHRAGDGANLAPPGSIVILKMTDTKGIMLLPGDEVYLLCRRQFEALAAVRGNQTFNAEEVATWELDYCRLEKPIIRPAEE